MNNWYFYYLHGSSLLLKTMGCFDMPSNRTNNMKDESSTQIVNTSYAKRGFTLALCARASGNKMAAFCVLKKPSGKIPANAMTTLVVQEQPQ